jgi:hypothetical protein
MHEEREQSKTGYAAFTARERELARSRARRDARDAVQDAGEPEDRPASTADRPRP